MLTFINSKIQKDIHEKFNSKCIASFCPILCRKKQFLVG